MKGQNEAHKEFEPTYHQRLVLVADDEVISQKLVKAAMERQGFQVIVTNNGQECLSALKSGISPSLLILDLDMPVMGGIDVLQELKQDDLVENFPIIIFSGSHNEDTIKRAIDLGADDYLLKPINVNDLVRRTTDLLFEVDEPALRDCLRNLRMQDPALQQAPGLQKWLNNPHDVYSTIYKGKTVCILVEQDVSPQEIAARPDFNEVMREIVILRKCSFGWRILWSNK